MKRISLIVVVLLAILCANKALAGDVVSWKDAAQYYGQHKTVEGTIVLAKCTPKVCFLNFHPDYKTYFTAVIFATDWGKFPANPDTFYEGKKVRVTGLIKEYQGKPEIILKHQGQIEVVK